MGGEYRYVVGMKILKVSLAGIVVFLIASLFLSVCWTQVIRPIMVQIDIAQGCNAYHAIKDGKNPTRLTFNFFTQAPYR